MNYSMILESYESCAAELRALEYDIAQEADGSSVDNSTVRASSATDNANNDLNDTANGDVAKSNTKFRERVKKLIETIRAHITMILDKFSQFVTNLMTTNKGFLAEVADYKRKYKVLDAVKIINWSYPNNPDQFLMTPLNLLGGEIQRQTANLAKFNSIPEDSILLMGEQERLKAILKIMNAPSDIENIPQYYLYLRTQFRGKKQEQTIRGEAADRYIVIVQNYDRKKTVFLQSSKLIKSQVDSTNATLQRVANDSNADNETKARVLKMSTALTSMINIYSNLAVLVNRMYGEYIINCRTIVRHLYEK